MPSNGNNHVEKLVVIRRLFINNHAANFCFSVDYSVRRSRADTRDFISSRLPVLHRNIWGKCLTKFGQGIDGGEVIECAAENKAACCNGAN